MGVPGAGCVPQPPASGWWCQSWADVVLGSWGGSFIPPLCPPHRLKQLREAPYTQEEAERAAGMGSYIPPKKVEVQTQPLDEVVAMEASS